jgi:WD40 repeat protein
VTSLWDLRRAVRLATLGEPVNEVNSVALSPDARHAVMGSAEGELRAWTLDWEIELA